MAPGERAARSGFEIPLKLNRVPGPGKLHGHEDSPGAMDDSVARVGLQLHNLQQGCADDDSC